MTKDYGISQLFVRLAIATAFLSAVADRLGYWGSPGGPNIAWGKWENFMIYSNQLNFFVPESAGELLAITATVLEVVFGFLLLIGYKTRLTAYLSGALLTLFALTMTLSLGIKSTFNYSVWVGAGAAFLLATVPVYNFSIDNLLANKKK